MFPLSAKYFFNFQAILFKISYKDETNRDNKNKIKM